MLLLALECLVMVVLLGLVAVHSALVVSFVRAARHFNVPLIDDEHAPRALVMLCLRGTDPFLKSCLSGLLKQEYPSYQVRIVVDSPEDPAHAVIAEVLDELQVTNVRVENLLVRRAECSLKCSAIRQVLDSLEPEFEIVAQLDADTIVHPTWLRELATALQPADVGLATGNRWFMPMTPGIGSIVRYIWNSGAVVQMHWHDFAWGGCFAIKRCVLQQSNLLKRWGRAFCDDTVLIVPVKKLGLRIAFVPRLMMINRENISLVAFYRWVCRQMLNVRLYHPAWPFVVVHGFVSTTAPLAALVLLIVTLSQGDLISSINLTAGLVIYVSSLFVSLMPMVAIMRKIAAHRSEPSRWISGWQVLKLAVAMPVTQVVHMAAIVSALVAKSTSWRGIDYRIDGPWRIRLEHYYPYRRPSKVPGDESLG
jgi:cellulose synthase/poly-beta-1,6-N-acetylglucosamine synthase-like glycosyltransferase